jgi:hypothetical protein
MTNPVCHFDQSGWNQWPDSEDLSAEFLRHLSAAKKVARLFRMLPHGKPDRPEEPGILVPGMEQDGRGQP